MMEKGTWGMIILLSRKVSEVKIKPRSSSTKFFSGYSPLPTLYIVAKQK